MKDKIVELIAGYKLSTADVADALGSKGHIVGVKPLSRGFYRVGEVHYIFAWYGSIWETHKELAKVPPGKILFFHNIGCTNSILGHLMAKYAIEIKNSVGIVVDGDIRDVDRMYCYPVWAKGFNPVICEKKSMDIDKSLVDKYRSKFHEGIIVCDDTGVVLIEPSRINQDTYQKLGKIQAREKDWYEKLHAGMSTFDITCKTEVNTC